MKSDEIDFLIELVRARSGQVIDRDKHYVIEQRLAPVARREGFASIREMLISVRQRADERLAWGLVEAMANGETGFFRDREPFTHFRQDVLPQLAKTRRGQPIRVLSAGCGGGQETYSLAMAVDEDRAILDGAQVEILGADLSERSLEKAQTGLYTQFEVQRGLPIRCLLEHFERRDEMWAIAPRLRAMAHWRRVNLNADLRGLGRFDVIFCRNVLSGMDAAMGRRMLANLALILARDGALFLGKDESARGLSEAFKPRGVSVYGVDPAFRAAA